MKIYGYATSPTIVQTLMLSDSQEERDSALFFTMTPPNVAPEQWLLIVTLDAPPTPKLPTDVGVPTALQMLATAEQEIRVRAENALRPLHDLKNSLLALPLED